jgi:hypothetical protein
VSIFWVSYAALWIIVLIQGFAFLEVLRQVGLLRRQIEPQQGAMIVSGAVDRGTPLPKLTGHPPHESFAAREWRDYFGDALGVIVFLTTQCVTCREVARDLPGLAADLSPVARVVAIIEGGRDVVEAFVSEVSLDKHLVIIDEDGTTARELGVEWRPAAVTVRDGGVAQAGIVNNVAQIDALVGEELTDLVPDDVLSMR